MNDMSYCVYVGSLCLMSVDVSATSDESGVTLLVDPKESGLDLSFFSCNFVVECVNCLQPVTLSIMTQSCSSATFNNNDTPSGNYMINTTVSSRCGETYELPPFFHQVGKPLITSLVMLSCM